MVGDLAHRAPRRGARAGRRHDAGHVRLPRHGLAGRRGRAPCTTRPAACSPGARLAVVAWLGYDAPATVSLDVLTAGRADQGARALRPLVSWLGTRGAQVALLCHSYGTVVCGRAAEKRDLAGDVTDLAVFGSPGLTVSSASGLHTGARLWAGRASGDWMRFVPDVRVLGVGFGADPAAPGFGARRFATGGGGHSDYLSPGGVSLRNLALIALGHTS